MFLLELLTLNIIGRKIIFNLKMEQNHMRAGFLNDNI